MQINLLMSDILIQAMRIYKLRNMKEVMGLKEKKKKMKKRDSKYNYD